MSVASKLDPARIAAEIAPRLAEKAAETDRLGVFPEQSFQLLRDTGLMGILVPQEYGGFGVSMSEYSEIAQILAGSCLSTAMVWAMHSQQSAVVAHFGSEGLRRRVLPRVAAGTMFIASVTSEHQKGGHLFTALSALDQEEEHFVLDREAPTVTGGAQGDGYLISMRAGTDNPLSDVVLIFADREQLDIQQRSGWSSMGMKGTQTIGMSLKGVLPPDQLLQSEGGFTQMAVSTLVPIGHIAWSSCWLGAAKAAYRQLLDIFRNPATRKGYNLSSELFAERLSRIRLNLDTVSAYLARVVAEYDDMRARCSVESAEFHAAWFNIHINNLKVLASETLFTAVDQMVQLGGLRFGYAHNPAIPLERTFRDLRSARLMYGNDRLLVANGKLALTDREVRLT
ncbi:acyl-CoA/acyl-ACP dehydrogenase [Paenibacillus athensensis]|uniref:Acyl-CoA dehydrogenase n=2 Tax=Paenibacillus athensensis TaxID=1967502 RepID=A0A4Y8Q8F5_9BACL|nr:acyl-CoA/acyl-ACP dehydrogenase [Paenibacillus athensensis]